MLKSDKNKRGSGVVVDPTVRDYGAPLEVIVGVDAGSTQTRVCIADKYDYDNLMKDEISIETLNNLKDQVYIIPSTYAVVNDEREILANSDNLEDNLDSHVILVRSAAVKPLVGSTRQIRGQKIKDAVGMVPRYLDSSTNKMDNAIFYANVLDGIGYALLQKYNGAIPNKVRINLVLSVRPKELNTHCTTRMNENFVGEFVFRWKTASIMMDICNIRYTTEPEAQIGGTSTIMDLIAELTDNEEAKAISRKFEESESYIHIEGGGSSIGVEVVKDGNIQDACSTTFPLGGNYLTQVTMDRLQSIKGRTMSQESVRNALITCLLKNGREREDITNIVAGCKDSVAYDILERLRHNVIDITSDLSLHDMDFITLGGRLFMEDDAGNSIGKQFAEYLSQISPNTEVIVLKDNYIPQGNLIIGMNEFDLSACGLLGSQASTATSGSGVEPEASMEE